MRGPIEILVCVDSFVSLPIYKYLLLFNFYKPSGTFLTPPCPLVNWETKPELQNQNADGNDKQSWMDDIAALIPSVKALAKERLCFFLLVFVINWNTKLRFRLCKT